MNDSDTRTTGSVANSSNVSEWCPDCDDVCEDHSRICTVCGATLQQRPLASPVIPQQQSQSQSQQQQLQRLPPSAQDTAARRTELRDLLERIRSEIDTVDEQQQALLHEFQNIRDGDINGDNNDNNDNDNNNDNMTDEWQAVPAAAMDPGQGFARSRPTAAETLKQLPRIKLTKDSFLFRRASLSFSDSNSNKTRLSSMQAIPGEFGSRAAFSLDHAALLVAQPRTGKGGKLSPETIAAIQHASTSTTTSTPTPVILYMERGDNLTFVAKALLAQQAGASALIVGNHTSQPWPYVMKDSVKEAVSGKLTIPVVMIKLADGQAIVANAPPQATPPPLSNTTTTLLCRLDIASESKECCVCRDEFAVDQTVLQLPSCSHVFHVTCATQWLTRHNTCPYCRYELPTDDIDYEQERRRTQRTHAGSQGGAGSTHWTNFYA